jgi:hypothetical protein
VSAKAPSCGNGSTAASTAFSTDPMQQFPVRRQPQPGQGDGVRAPHAEAARLVRPVGLRTGQFGTLHHMAVGLEGQPVCDGGHARSSPRTVASRSSRCSAR